ncbi:MAG: hypothetical protein ACI9UQ_000678, partial [Candidatus Krumholzibacteriia bacterium]
MKRMRKVGFLFVLVLADLCTAAGTHLVEDGWLLGKGGVAIFLSGQSQQSTGLWSTVGHSALYQMNEFPATQASFGARLGEGWAKTTIAASWHVLGSGMFGQQNAELHLQWGQSFAVGFAGSILQTTSGGAHGFAVQKSMRWRLSLTGNHIWEVGALTQVRTEVWLPLASAVGEGFVDARTRLLRIQGWHERVAFGVAVDLKPNLAPTMGLEWDLAWGAAALGLRLDPSTGVVGPVVYLRRAKLLVQTSHLVHPQLGVTHRFQIGVGNWGA